MALNPTTMTSIDTVRDYTKDRPGGDNEKTLVGSVVATAIRELPIDRALLGEALIQFSRLMDAAVIRIRKFDPTLDWESVTTIALNILTVAGAELYLGADAGSDAT
jgi:hypothetical protein